MVLVKVPRPPPARDIGPYVHTSQAIGSLFFLLHKGGHTVLKFDGRFQYDAQGGLQTSIQFNSIDSKE